MSRSFIDVCSATGPRHVATIDDATNGIGWINGDKDLAFLSTTSPVLTPDHVWTVAAAAELHRPHTQARRQCAMQLSVDVKGKCLGDCGARREVGD